MAPARTWVDPAGSVHVATTALEAVTGHARRSYPLEACGFLLGYRRASGPERVVTEGVAGTNAVSTDAGRRFEIVPAEAWAMEERARAGGVDLVGFYHSHPDRSPLPSALDALHAWPGPVHLIVAVTALGTGAMRAFEAVDGGRRLAELPIRSDRPGASSPDWRR